MSKKKNTLSDLEEFLKLQASSLVTPASLVDKVQKEEVQPIEIARPSIRESAPASFSEDDLSKALQQLSLKDKKAFYSFIIKTTKDLPNYSTEDTLLINTALYLKGGPNWKETGRSSEENQF
jgi:hypothetical protein